MKITKKVLSVVLSLLMLVGLMSITTQAVRYNDVSASNALLDAINYAADNKLIEPSSTGYFYPSRAMTRAEMVLMLYRYDTSPYVSGTISFNDVPANAPYAKAVLWAVQKGITNGTSTTTFEPDTAVKRQDAAVMLWKYAGTRGFNTESSASLSHFTDAGNISSYAKDAVRWVVENNIMHGTSSTTFEPRVSTKRSAAAAMIQRFGINVDRFWFFRDVYGFTNDPSNFYISNSSSYYGGNEHFIFDNDMNRMAVGFIHAGITTTSSLYEDIMDNIVSKWEGACSGMITSAMLDKQGQINVNIRNREEKKFSQLPCNKHIESLINYYQVIQYIMGLEYTNALALSYAFEELINTIDNDKMCYVSFGYYNEDNEMKYHAVGAHRVEQDSADSDIYRIYVYDPNNKDYEGYFLYNSDTFFSPEIKYYSDNSNDYIQVKKLAFMDINTLCEVYKPFDIDGDYNLAYDFPDLDNDFSSTTNISEVNATIDLESNNTNIVRLVAEDRKTIYVSTTNDFCIRNKEGEVLQFNSSTEEFFGDMDVYRTAWTTGKTGELLILTVPCSESYTITTSNNDTAFYVLSTDSFVGATVTNLQSATITNDSRIHVIGNGTILNHTSHSNITSSAPTTYIK